MPNDEFPTPTRPYSLKEMVKKIKSDPAYADFIHKKVSEARKGNEKAIELVQAHFEPETSELTSFGLTDQQANDLKRCTDPRTHLVDFVYYVANPPA